MIRWLLPAITLALLSLPVVGRWGSTGCSAVAAPVSAAGWFDSTRYPGWTYHRDQAGTVTAWYNPATGEYLADRHGRLVPMDPPWRVGEAERNAIGAHELPDWMTQGVDRSKLSPQEKVTVNGREIAKSDAIDLIGGPLRRPRPQPTPPDPPDPGPKPTPPDLPNDAAKLRLTCIGSEADCGPFLNDWKAGAYAAVADKLVLQTYRPDNWALRPGFKTDGKPTIYLQAPDGRVLLRRDDYAGGAAELVASIRKADPNYDPAKDPDGKAKPAPAPKVDPLPPATPSWNPFEDLDPTSAILALALLVGWLFWACS